LPYQKGYFMNALDELLIYKASDGEIIGELQNRLIQMRRSCCFSQQKLSELSGVSIATIKRLESHNSQDISLTVIIRLLRSMSQLDGVSKLIPEVPDSPFISRKNGKTAKRISSKTCRR